MHSYIQANFILPPQPFQNRVSSLRIYCAFLQPFKVIILHTQHKHEKVFENRMTGSPFLKVITLLLFFWGGDFHIGIRFLPPSGLDVDLKRSSEP